MKIGIGLPNTLPGTPGTLLVEWARTAESRGFTGLSTIDRVVYPNYDSLATLAAAAGATSRISLLTNILLAPVYPPALLAKTTASIDQLSGGRLTLGLAPGGRPDDYTAVGRDFSRRGKDFDAELDYLHRAWQGESMDELGKPLGPVPIGGRVPVLVGGGGPAAIRRAVEWGAGLTVAGGGPEQVGPLVGQLRDAWQAAGRTDEPRIAALAYFSLGEDAAEVSRAYLRDYYAFLGEFVDVVAESALRSADALRGAVSGFADAGITELYLNPTVASLDQVERLADVVL